MIIGRKNVNTIGSSHKKVRYLSDTIFDILWKGFIIWVVVSAPSYLWRRRASSAISNKGSAVGNAKFTMAHVTGGWRHGRDQDHVNFPSDLRSAA